MKPLRARSCPLLRARGGHASQAWKDTSPAGYHTLTFHGLRHVATSLMVEAGEHPRVIQQRLGHASARLSMELYAHVPEVADREVALHLDDRFCRGSGSTVRPG